MATVSNPILTTTPIDGAVYRQLQDEARRNLWREGTDPGMEPGDLVHEALLRLARSRTLFRFEGSSHLLELSKTAMRRILIDGARGGWAPRRLRCVPLDCEQLSLKDESFGMSPLQDALDRLERHATDLHRIVNLRFFGGLRIAEISSALSISPATVDRKIRASLDFLRSELLKGTSCAQLSVNSRRLPAPPARDRPR
jgi:RNA polymerase sigma factor (TIGR02999 family)